MSMDTAIATAVSGLHANAERFRVAAFNVVNANTDGFKAHLATTVSEAPAGVRTETTVSDAPVDLATEYVNMTVAQIGYDADAKVISSLERMNGALLDITA